VVPWANGLGTTAVIVRVPDIEAWTWRLSLADVVVDGPFSPLPGVDRWIAVASGGGMVLTVGDDSPVDLRAGPDAFFFSGDLATTCRLIDGPIVDVNLMLRRGAAVGRLSIVTSAAGTRCPLEGVVAAVMLAGSATWSSETLSELDALVGIERGDLTGDVDAATDCRLALIHVEMAEPASM